MVPTTLFLYPIFVPIVVPVCVLIGVSVDVPIGVLIVVPIGVSEDISLPFLRRLLFRYSVEACPTNSIYPIVVPIGAPVHVPIVVPIGVDPISKGYLVLLCYPSRNLCRSRRVRLHSHCRLKHPVKALSRFKH